MADEDRTDATEETKSEAAETTGFDGILDDVDNDAGVAVEESPESTTETTEKTKEDDSDEGAESVSDELYAEADKAGLSHAQADELGTDGLTRVLRRLTTPDSALVSDAPASRDATETLVEEPSGTKQAGVVLDPDLVDETIIQRFEGLESTSARQIGQLQERLHKLTVEAEMREERETSARFNGYIDSLGKSWSKEFGTTNPTRSQQGNRSEIRTNMEVERIGRESLGLPNFAEDQLFQRALSKGHPEKAMQLAREQITSQLKTNAKKIISRPTQAKEKQLTGKQKARISVRAKLAAMGRSSDSTSPEEDEASVFGE